MTLESVVADFEAGSTGLETVGFSTGLETFGGGGNFFTSSSSSLLEVELEEFPT